MGSQLRTSSPVLPGITYYTQPHCLKFHDRKLPLERANALFSHDSPPEESIAVKSHSCSCLLPYWEVRAGARREESNLGYRSLLT